MIFLLLSQSTILLLYFNDCYWPFFVTAWNQVPQLLIMSLITFAILLNFVSSRYSIFKIEEMINLTQHSLLLLSSYSTTPNKKNLNEWSIKRIELLLTSNGLSSRSFTSHGAIEKRWVSHWDIFLIESQQFLSFCGIPVLIHFTFFLILHDRYRWFLIHVIKLNSLLLRGRPC